MSAIIHKRGRVAVWSGDAPAREPYTKPTMTKPTKSIDAARVFMAWCEAGHIDELLRDLLRRRLDTGYPPVPAIVSAAQRVVDCVFICLSCLETGSDLPALLLRRPTWRTSMKANFAKIEEVAAKYAPSIRQVAIRRIFGKSLRQLVKTGENLRTRRPRKPAPHFRAALRERQKKARHYPYY